MVSHPGMENKMGWGRLPVFLCPETGVGLGPWIKAWKFLWEGRPLSLSILPDERGNRQGYEVKYSPGDFESSRVNSS